MNFTKNYWSFTVTIAIMALLLTGFINTNSQSDPEKLVGTWVYKSYKDGTYTYVKVANFKAKKPGFRFEPNGKLTKRVNSHWCARVKEPYTNLAGSYKLIDADKIELSYQCPISDKPTISRYKILDLSKKKLVYRSLP